MLLIHRRRLQFSSPFTTIFPTPAVARHLSLAVYVTSSIHNAFMIGANEHAISVFCEQFMKLMKRLASFIQLRRQHSTVALFSWVIGKIVYVLVIII